MRPQQEYVMRVRSLEATMDETVVSVRATASMLAPHDLSVSFKTAKDRAPSIGGDIRITLDWQAEGA